MSSSQIIEILFHDGVCRHLLFRGGTLLWERVVYALVPDDNFIVAHHVTDVVSVRAVDVPLRDMVRSLSFMVAAVPVPASVMVTVRPETAMTASTVVHISGHRRIIFEIVAATVALTAAPAVTAVCVESIVELRRHRLHPAVIVLL